METGKGAEVKTMPDFSGFSFGKNRQFRKISASNIFWTFRFQNTLA